MTPPDTHEVLAEPTMAFRLLPRLDDLNRPFWTGGEHGELRMLRCRDCGCWLHPPSPRCSRCHGTSIGPDTLSGRATLHTYTVNHQAWIPGIDLPYLVAIVDLPEQDGLRLTTNLVGVGPDDVTIGMALEVVFEHHDDVWIPLFRPAGAGGTEEAPDGTGSRDGAD